MPDGGPEERWETSSWVMEGAGRSLQVARVGVPKELCAWGRWAWHRARSGEDRQTPFCRALPTLAGGRPHQ